MAQSFDKQQKANICTDALAAAFHLDPGMLEASHAQLSGLLGLVGEVSGRKGCAGWVDLSPGAFRPELHSCCDPLHCSWHAFYFHNFLQ